MLLKYVFTYSIVSLALLSLNSICAQNLVDVQTGFSYSENKATSITHDQNGTIYYSIEHTSELIVGGNTVAGNENRSATLVKKTKSGNSEVIYTHTGTGALYNTTARYFNGIVFICGVFNDSLIFSDTTYTCSNLKAFYLISIDSTGKLVNRFVSNSYSASINDLFVNTNGVYVGGDFFGPLLLDSNTYNSAPGVNFLLIKFDHNLTPICMSQSNGSATNISGINSDTNGNILCIGSYGPETSISGQNLPTVSGDHNLYCAKFTSNLQLMWVQTITGNVQVHGTSITTNLDNEIFVGGEFEMNLDYGNQIICSKGQMDGLVAKLDPLGTVQWIKSIGGPNSDQVRSIQCNSQNDLLIGLNLGRNATLENDSLTVSGFSEPFLVALNSQDQVKWITSLPAAPSTGTVSIEELLAIDSSIYMCGSNKTGLVFQNTIVDSDNLEDFFLAEFSDSTLNQVLSTSELEHILFAYPNPYQSYSELHLSPSTYGILSITDIAGNSIRLEDFYNDRIANGCYFIRLFTKQNQSTTIKITKL